MFICTVKCFHLFKKTSLLILVIVSIIFDLVCINSNSVALVLSLNSLSICLKLDSCERVEFCLFGCCLKIAEGFGVVSNFHTITI